MESSRPCIHALADYSRQEYQRQLSELQQSADKHHRRMSLLLLPFLDILQIDVFTRRVPDLWLLYVVNAQDLNLDSFKYCNAE